MNAKKIKQIISNHITDAKIIVQNIDGKNDHFNISVTSKIFQKLPIIEQHKIVMKPLAKYINKHLSIHAVKINTYTK
jgi:acid stress-induced BolA-like protein IbaG/YrbA